MKCSMLFQSRSQKSEEDSKSMSDALRQQGNMVQDDQRVADLMCKYFA